MKFWLSPVGASSPARIAARRRSYNKIYGNALYSSDSLYTQTFLDTCSHPP